MAKKVYSSIVLCMRKVLVRSVLVLCINVVIATKKVTEKVKKWWKIAILWLFLSHRGCHMAPRPQKHEYLLATMFCTKFEHFRMSGSIICTQLFLSLTRCFKGTSFFKEHGVKNLCNNCTVAKSFFYKSMFVWRIVCKLHFGPLSFGPEQIFL